MNNKSIIVVILLILLLFSMFLVSPRKEEISDAKRIEKEIITESKNIFKEFPEDLSFGTMEVQQTQYKLGAVGYDKEGIRYYVALLRPHQKQKYVLQWDDVVTIERYDLRDEKGEDARLFTYEDYINKEEGDYLKQLIDFLYQKTFLKNIELKEIETTTIDIIENSTNKTLSKAFLFVEFYPEEDHKNRFPTNGFVQPQKTFRIYFDYNNDGEIDEFIEQHRDELKEKGGYNWIVKKQLEKRGYLGDVQRDSLLSFVNSNDLHFTEIIYLYAGKVTITLESKEYLIVHEKGDWESTEIKRK